MATIPIGNFGNSIAQPQQAARVSPGAFGAAEGEALNQVGQQVQEGALQQIQKQTRLDQQIADREKQTTAMRVRVTKTNDLADAQEQLSRDILSGSVPKDKAEEEWSYRAGKVLENATGGIAPEYSGALQVEFEGLQRRGANSIRDTVVRRDLDDTRTNIETTAEQYQRMATRDRPKAVAEFGAILDAASNLPQSERAKTLQNFKEQTAYTNAFSLVRGSSRNLGEVRAARDALEGDQFSDVDPQKKAALHAQLDGYETNIILRQEAAAREAQRRQEAALHRADAAFKASQARVDAGLFDNTEQIAKTTQLLAGTPYLDTYRELQVQARNGGGAASKSIPQQQADLDQLKAQMATRGSSDELVAMRQRRERTLASSEADFKKDGLRAYAERVPGAVIPEIDVSSIDGLMRSLDARLEFTDQASRWAGKQASPFTSDESQRMGVLLAALPVPQRAAALATLGQQLGPQAATGLANQLDPQDRALSLALKVGTDRTTSGRFTSELILRGQQALKEKTIKGEDTASADWRAAIAKELGDGRGFASDTARLAVSDTSYLINAGLAAEGRVGFASGSGFNTSKQDAAQAVRLAVGGPMIDFNGVRIPIPAGLDESGFNQRIKTLTPVNFSGQVSDGKVLVGGAAVPLADFIKTLPEATLTSTGSGTYNVVSGNRVVTNTAGERITIKAR